MCLHTFVPCWSKSWHEPCTHCVYLQEGSYARSQPRKLSRWGGFYSPSFSWHMFGSSAYFINKFPGGWHVFCSSASFLPASCVASENTFFSFQNVLQGCVSICCRSTCSPSWPFKAFSPSSLLWHVQQLSFNSQPTSLQTRPLPSPGLPMIQRTTRMCTTCSLQLGLTNAWHSTTFSVELVNQNFHNTFAVANNVQTSAGSITVTLPVIPTGCVAHGKKTYFCRTHVCVVMDIKLNSWILET